MRPIRAVMRSRLHPLAVLIVVVLSGATTATLEGQQGTATVTLLPFLDANAAFVDDTAYDVTNQGIAIGTSSVGNSFVAVRWEANGTVTGLGADPDFPDTDGFGISGSGQVACGLGYSEDFSVRRAFIWTPAQGIRRLPDFDSERSQATVVSDNGAFVWGKSTMPSGFEQVVRWNAGTLAPTAIPNVPDSIGEVYVSDVSADGQIAVGSEETTRGRRALRITPNGPSLLPRLPGAGSARAAGISPDGSIVVGYQYAPDGGTDAFIWRSGVGTLPLPRLTASSFGSTAYQIAENGVIVGQDGVLYSGAPPRSVTAMLWIAERPFNLRTYLESEYGLDLSNWRALQAIYGISRNGRHLTGIGVVDGETRSFRVTFSGNLPPVANAGTDIRKNDAAPKGINVKLDGRKSVDPDGTFLSFRWSGIRFDDQTIARPTAKFPVGTTTVTLRVTDPGGVSSTDTVRVIVKAKRSSSRPQGLAANEAFADASALTATASDSAETNEAALIAAENAACADALGAAIGDAFVWGEDESPAGAAADYGALRLLQSQYGQAAAASLAQAYLETGDAAYAEAYRSATRGTQRALADLAE